MLLLLWWRLEQALPAAAVARLCLLLLLLLLLLPHSLLQRSRCCGTVCQLIAMQLLQGCTVGLHQQQQQPLQGCWLQRRDAAGAAERSQAARKLVCVQALADVEQPRCQQAREARAALLHVEGAAQLQVGQLDH
jgi:hypothetical protein